LEETHEAHRSPNHKTEKREGGSRTAVQEIQKREKCGGARKNVVRNASNKWVTLNRGGEEGDDSSVVEKALHGWKTRRPPWSAEA